MISVPTNDFANSSFAIINFCDSFLFQIRDNKKNIWYPNMFGFFGGKIENYENEHDAIVREIKEETNLSIKKFKLLNFISLHNKNKIYTRYVFYKDLNRFPDLIKVSEGQGYRLLTVNEIQKFKSKIIPMDYMSISNYLRVKKGMYLF